MSSTLRSSGDWIESDEDTAADSDVEIQLLEKLDAASKVPSGVSWPTSKLLHTIRGGRRLQWCSIGRTIILAIKPSFITRQYAEQASETKSSNGIPALDGLRGLACLFVINEHLTYNLSTTFLHGYGDAGLKSIIQWPFIRIFWSGFSMVAIFYVISGYVLSYKPLKQIRNRDMASFQRTLTSSIFRRAARLYLPTIIAVLLCGIFTYLGAFRYSSYLFSKNDNYLNLHEPLPPTFDSFGTQMLDTAKAALRMLNIWDWTDDLSAGDYDLHTWTIVVEFRSSMILFLLLIGTSRLKQKWRIVTTSAFLIFCILTQRKDVLLFVAGMLLADIDLTRTSHQQPHTVLPATTHHTRSHTFTYCHAQQIWLLLFLLGLYLASVPVFGVYTTPGYITLSTTLTPPSWDAGAWLRCLGAILITWSAVNSRWLQPIFTNPVSHYLGKTSFALYLVHGNVIKSLGYSILPWIYGLVNGGRGGREGLSTGGVVAAWVLSVLLVMPVVAWLADVFWREVDLRCVRAARWVEAKTT